MLTLRYSERDRSFGYHSMGACLRHNDRSLGAVILAAGKGTRMHSSKPKVLHELLGEPMLAYVVDQVGQVVDDRIWTVVGHGAELVAATFPTCPWSFVLQSEQLGTGHALACAWERVRESELTWCLVVNGDVPLLTARELVGFFSQVMDAEADLAFVSLTLKEPGSYGRVIRDRNGKLSAIAEAKDFDPVRHGGDQGEVNAGIYCLKVDSVTPLFGQLTCDNAQGEFYITQLVDLGVNAGLNVMALPCGEGSNLLGVNSPNELAEAEEYLRRANVAHALDRGAIIRQGASVRLGPGVVIEPGAALTGPCEIYGKSRIRTGSEVHSHCWIRDSDIGEQAVVRSFSHIEGALVGRGCVVGPYARLRPKTVLKDDARVGNFVEVKNALLEQGVKANHLSYIGDAEIGQGTNIGAGTITCNYDGRHKHRTVIKANAFVGSNTALVAPVTIGERALIGAGSTITKDVPDDTLAIGRTRQSNLPKRKR